MKITQPPVVGGGSVDTSNLATKTEVTAIDSKVSSMLSKSKNIFNKNDPTIENAKTLGATGGSQTYTSNPRFVTHYIPVVAKTKYKVNKSLGNNAYYDANKVFLEMPTFTSNTDGTQTIAASVSDSAAFLRLTILGDLATTDATVAEEAEYNGVQPFGQKALQDNLLDKPKIANYLRDNKFIDSLNGKTAYFLGDSLTGQGKITGALTTKTGLAITNYGVGGTCLADTSGTKTDAMVYRWNQMAAAQPDFIFVMGGTNDCTVSTIGDVTDTGVNTMAGAVYTIVNGLQAKYPNSKIVFSCMPRRFDGRFDEYAKVVRDACAYHSIPCVDAFNQCGINPMNYTQFTLTNDKVHFNEEGGKRIASLIADMLKRVNY